MDAIRSIIHGHAPKASRLAQVCDGIGLVFYVVPPCPPLTVKPEIEYGRLPLYSVPDITATVSDPALATIIAVMADAWERSTEMEGSHLLDRFELAF